MQIELHRNNVYQSVELLLLVPMLFLLAIPKCLLIFKKNFHYTSLYDLFAMFNFIWLYNHYNAQGLQDYLLLFSTQHKEQKRKGRGNGCEGKNECWDGSELETESKR